MAGGNQRSRIWRHINATKAPTPRSESGSDYAGNAQPQVTCDRLEMIRQTRANHGSRDPIVLPFPYFAVERACHSRIACFGGSSRPRGRVCWTCAALMTVRRFAETEFSMFGSLLRILGSAVFGSVRQTRTISTIVRVMGAEGRKMPNSGPVSDGLRSGSEECARKMREWRKKREAERQGRTAK